LELITEVREQHRLLDSIRQITADALGPHELIVETGFVVVAREQDDVMKIAILIADCADINFAFGQRGNLKLLHCISFSLKGIHGA
jgi:hypothetical protein